LLTQEVTSSILDAIRKYSGSDILTDRESEVLAYAAKEGMTNEQIAKTLFISISTVKTHLSNIYGKVGVNEGANSRAQAIKWFNENVENDY
jgi:DNA-binding CsgD family transcriptional regulator